MGENSYIQWTDHINPRASGRVLGTYKSAATKVGCSVEEWMARRGAGDKWCFRCRSWKPGEQFSLDRSRGGGRTSSCKPCTSDASTASRYGMSPADLISFRAVHGGKCGICEASDLLYIDHDHRTGKPRGLLCPSCNSAIGLLNEDPELFARALSYLGHGREWNGVHHG